MSKSLSFIIYKLLKFFDNIFNIITRKSFLIWFKEFLEKESYTSLIILKKKIKFFTPNYITKWLVISFYKKEPEIINWINKFKKKKIIFWDIGANIGLYSIYSAIKHNNIKIISFEPSTSNLRILSRNISINNLSNKITINQIALGNIENKYLMFNEKLFEEGIGEHAFGASKNQNNKTFKPKNKYKIYGTTIKFLLQNKILEIPDYIKIDVDGIEHLILDGASKFLKNKKIKSIYVEINKNYKNQYYKIKKLMKKNNFYFDNKYRSILVDNYLKNSKSNIHNYIFYKKESGGRDKN